MFKKGDLVRRVSENKHGNHVQVKIGKVYKVTEFIEDCQALGPSISVAGITGIYDATCFELVNRHAIDVEKAWVEYGDRKHMETSRILNKYAQINDAGEDQSSLDGTLKTRGNRYGEFKDNANLTAQLMATIEDADIGSTKQMNSMQREALHIICQKISRICNGDASYADNWHDIAGYATLIDNSLKD